MIEKSERKEKVLHVYRLLRRISKKHENDNDWCEKKACRWVFFGL